MSPEKLKRANWLTAQLETETRLLHFLSTDPPRKLTVSGREQNYYNGNLDAAQLAEILTLFELQIRANHEQHTKELEEL
jgi:hypothetical protein